MLPLGISNEYIASSSQTINTTGRPALQFTQTSYVSPTEPIFFY